MSEPTNNDGKLPEAPWRAPATEANPPAPPKGEEGEVLEHERATINKPHVSPDGTIGPLIDIGGPGMQP